jgi:hypothetical protein
MEGEPSRERVERWEKRGFFHYEKHYNPPQLEGRIKLLREKYFQGLCHICAKFPLYKVTYKLPGVRLVEYYCQEHI